MLEDDSGLTRGPYHYEAFGLHIASDVLLPEFLPAIDSSAEPEVSIGLGEVPSGILGAAERNDVYQVARNEFLLRVQGVGGYYVTNGNCIVVEPDGRSEDRFVRLFLLGTAFGSLLLQRGIVPVHGSAVVFEGYCVVFTGASGVGKSTLSAAFRERGYAILTDDVAAVKVNDDGAILVQPGCPQQRLRRDSMAAVGLEAPHPWLLDSREDEFAIPLDRGFCPTAVPLGAIYELAVGTRRVAISRLSIMEKITVLINNTWFRLVDGLGLKTDHLRQCLDIAGIVPVSRLTRPDGVFSLEEQMRQVEEDLRTNSPPAYYERRMLC